MKLSSFTKCFNSHNHSCLTEEEIPLWASPGKLNRWKTNLTMSPAKIKSRCSKKYPLSNVSLVQICSMSHSYPSVWSLKISDLTNKEPSKSLCQEKQTLLIANTLYPLNKCGQLRTKMMFKMM